MNSALTPRLLIGFVVMAAACLTAFRLGDRTVRMAAALVAACWTLTTASELITGHQVGPVIAGNVVAAAGFLLLASSYGDGWLWALTAIEAALFMLHAWFYGTSETPTPAWIVTNNLLALAILVVLVVATFASRRARRQTA